MKQIKSSTNAVSPLFAVPVVGAQIMQQKIASRRLIAHAICYTTPRMASD